MNNKTSYFESAARGLYSLYSEYQNEDWDDSWKAEHSPHALPVRNTLAYFSKQKLEIVSTHVQDIVFAKNSATHDIVMIIDTFYEDHPALSLIEGYLSPTLNVLMQRLTADGFPTRSKVGLFTLTFSENEIRAEIMSELMAPSSIVVLEYFDSLQKK